MRGRRDPQATMLAFIDLESRVPSAHPLRVIKALTDQALDGLSDTFDEIIQEALDSLPAELRDQVTSPGGTTEAALKSMAQDHVKEAIIKAIKAANERSRELGAELGRD